MDMARVWRSFRVRGARASAVALVLACATLAAACSTPRGTVTLLVTSNAPVKATASQLRQGVAQEVKDWADARARIEEIQTRRLGEMLAIEADIAFLDEVAKIDAGAPGAGRSPDPGRLQRLLGTKASAPTFEEQLQQALAPPVRVRDPESYFKTYLAGRQAGASPVQQDRFAKLWTDLGRTVGAPITGGPEMAEWLRSQRVATWDDLLVRYAREDSTGRVVTGADVAEIVLVAARDLGIDPPPVLQIGLVSSRAIARLRHRREQFPKVDRLLSNLLTIAQDLDTYLQNDTEAIHWRELGEALGKAQSISTELTGEGPNR